LALPRFRRRCAALPGSLFPDTRAFRPGLHAAAAGAAGFGRRSSSVCWRVVSPECWGDEPGARETNCSDPPGFGNRPRARCGATRVPGFPRARSGARPPVGGRLSGGHGRPFRPGLAPRHAGL